MKSISGAEVIFTSKEPSFNGSHTLSPLGLVAASLHNPVLWHHRPQICLQCDRFSGLDVCFCIKPVDSPHSCDVLRDAAKDEECCIERDSVRMV